MSLLSIFALTVAAVAVGVAVGGGLLVVLLWLICSPRDAEVLAGESGEGGAE